MQFPGAKNNNSGSRDPLDEVVRQIARLVRHPAYRRQAVVSAQLLRHLPFDGGYQWAGEAVLRERLAKAKLDGSSLVHLAASAGSEWQRLKGPVDA